MAASDIALADGGAPSDVNLGVGGQFQFWCRVLSGFMPHYVLALLYNFFMKKAG
jgi:hypothetical protein